MTRLLNVREVFEEFSERYDKFMLETKHIAASNTVLKELKEEIRGEVLDVATGSGSVAIWLSKNTAATKIEGVDFSERMIQEALDKAKGSTNLTFSVQDVENLRFPSHIFDVVICCLGCCWFTHLVKALSEMSRVCKNHGKIVLLEEQGTILTVQKLLKEVNADETIKTLEELHENITIREIKELMGQLSCNLTKETKVIPIDENHGLVGLVFEKQN